MFGVNADYVLGWRYSHDMLSTNQMALLINNLKFAHSAPKPGTPEPQLRHARKAP